MKLTNNSTGNTDNNLTHAFFTERSGICTWRCLQHIVVFIFVFAFFFTTCRPVFGKDLVHPETVPDWYNVDTCMEIMNILVDEYSLSVEGAAAICGNICQESKYNPNANSGYYIGLCQWDPNDRWPLISGWIWDRGYSTDSPAAQVRAIYGDENGRAEGDRYAETLEYMKSVSSIEDGVNRWLVYYEGAAGQQEAERVSYAYDALELYNANK